MVGYEMNLLLSRTASPYRSLELVRRCANMVVGSGGVVKQVQNHGIRPLGYKIRQNNETHTDAHYISFQADMNPRVSEPLTPVACVWGLASHVSLLRAARWSVRCSTASS